MTAEVVLLNKRAVVMAADSAVTFTSWRGHKVYNAGNKVFALSKRHPVGVMVYGNAEYMGMPWETIIKEYREGIGTRAFDTLEQHFAHLVEFLGGNDDLFGPDAQEDYVAQRAMQLFIGTRNAIRKRVDAYIETGASVDDARVREIAGNEVREERKRWRRRNFAAGMDEAFEAQILTQYGPTIRDAQAAVFQKLPLTKGAKTGLLEMVGRALTRDHFSSATSGLVVAGFGAREYLPSVRAATVEGRVAGRLHHRVDDHLCHSIDRRGASAAVVPFAQTDAVSAFIEGIDPRYSQDLTKLVRGAFGDLTDFLLQHLVPDESLRQQFAGPVHAMTQAITADLQTTAAKLRRERYVNPLLEVIEALPKDELASVAESLVSITSLKRKVSMDVESVGGPVDVAIISKGDGLVWVNRKHYFRPELNPQFAHNYFQPRAAANASEQA